MDKFKSFMEKFKKNFLLYVIVWFVLAILFVAPVTYTRTEAILQNHNWVEAVYSNIVDNIFKFPIRFVFGEIYIYDFKEGMKYYSLFYWAVVLYSIYKTLPKGGFDKIEHGSSDWCSPGEQYKVLSKKSGLLLAKDNYLPLDKTGNINVLIVGRIWCW